MQTQDHFLFIYKEHSRSWIKPKKLVAYFNLTLPSLPSIMYKKEKGKLRKSASCLLKLTLWSLSLQIPLISFINIFI